MYIPKPDRRDRHDILNQLRALAQSYVPEWRWDDEEPDVGVILAHLYAAMMENTISKYDRSVYNHYLTFLNLLGTRLMPPSPAEGLITVGASPDSEGVFLGQGTAVYAAAETETGRVFYETVEAVNVLDTRVDHIFFTSAVRDSIVCAYDGAGESEPVRLFGFDTYLELQRHVLYFRDDHLFCTGAKTDLTVFLSHSRSQKLSRAMQTFFSQPETAAWELYSGGEWRRVDEVRLEGNGIRLTADRGSGPVEAGGEASGCFLRCRLKRLPDGGVTLTDVGWTVQGSGLSVDTAVQNGGVELPQESFSPFGDLLALYADFQISSGEAFHKPGATVDVEFDLDYFKSPIERADQEADPTNYRSIMMEEDFLTRQERDVWIERVQWEYWNGRGWARLFPDGRYEAFFTPSSGGGRKRLTFRCPSDMAELLTGAFSGPFLRARIEKLSHMSSTLGNYVCPFVRHMELSYHYEDGPIPGREVRVESNAEICCLPLPDSGNQPLAAASLCPEAAMYLCFTAPLTGGPIRIFWDIEEGVFPDAAPLRWEYYGVTANGEPGWKSLEVMDQTENLTKSAIVTLMGKKDFQKVQFFGAEGYYIRLLDISGHYDGGTERAAPVVRAIRPNTVPVIQRERRLPEYFYIGRGEKRKRCVLSVPNLAEAKVWVNEFGMLSVKEEERLLADPETIVKRDPAGRVSELWAAWRETDNLQNAGGDERVFMVDYARSAVVFGDGRHGRIPVDSDQESIMVEYTVCDGSYGNIDAGGILGFAAKPDGIASVTNYKRISGGADMETIEQAARRSTGELLGMGRIVTLEDVERSVLSSNRNLYRVKCVPHVDRYGHHSSGALAVAVLPREYRRGSEAFEAVVCSARQAIRERASLLLTGMDLFEVRYVEISVSVSAVISDENRYHEVSQSIYRRLSEFLDPITGNLNGQGWEIGHLPGPELIYNSIKTIKYVKWIKNLHIFPCTVTENGKQAVEFEAIRRDRFTVPVFGGAEIDLTVDEKGL